MKSLQQHIEEKLVINKDFKGIMFHWRDVTELFSITFNNTKETFYLVCSFITNKNQIKKITNTEFCYDGTKMLNSNHGDGRSGDAKINNDKGFLYETSDFGYIFSEIIVHPNYANEFKELCKKCVFGKEYDFNFIINKFGINENDLPKDFFKCQKYTFSSQEENINEIIEYIENRK